MFTENFSLMFYVDDVAAEKEFWQAVGFEIVATMEAMGYQSFEMRPNAKSSTMITVYDKEFIRQVSPEVADNVPSILFESDDIYTLQEKVAEQTDTASPVQDQPFLNFNFASPSGHYFAVKGV